MKTKTYKLKDLEKVVIGLGYVGENDHTRVVIDAGEVFGDHPQATVGMAVVPPMGERFPVTVSRDGDNVEWTVKNSVLINDGDGLFQLTFVEGSEIIKSCRGHFRVKESIPDGGEAPDPIQDWIDEANEVVEEAREAAAAAEHQPRIGQTGYWEIWDLQEGQYVTTGVKAQGEQGDPGPAGEDGAPGRDGADGQDGYTPVRGTDYWTEQDQAAIVADVKNDLVDDTAGEGDTDKVWSADKSAETASQLLNAIQGVEGKLLRSDLLVNLYEPQSMEDIEDGKIIFNGNPYSASWSKYYYSSDYVPVTGGKTIKFNYAPWGGANTGLRAAEYDSNKTYIRNIDSTIHELSSNAAYIRFSVKKNDFGSEVGAVLDFINGTLLITDGTETTGDSGIDETINTFLSETAVRTMDQYFVDSSTAELLILWKLPGVNGKDVGIKLKAFDANAVYTFCSFGIVNNPSNFVGNKPENYVEFMSASEDWISPMKINAVNNADGDTPNTLKWTGGMHTVNSVNTARRTKLDIYFDGRKNAGFVGYCKTIDIVIVHRITASNTFKSDGTGREVVEQTTRMHFESGVITVETQVKALEAVNVYVWYFIQGLHKPSGLGSSGIRYIGGEANRGINPMNTGSVSGDLYARSMRFLSQTLQMEMTMDDFDIGRMTHNNESSSCFVEPYTNYSKAYYNAINNTTTPLVLNESDSFVARGSYKFGIFE